MAARVQVVVETKSIGSGILRGITSEMGMLGNIVDEVTKKNVNWGTVAGMAATMVIKGLKESVKATLDYADSVRSLSMLSGESTESSSRFIQVLDDYKISADDALLATKALTKNGLAPSIDTLAQLSDQYLALNSVEEKNAFILKNLGKGGLQWVEVLNKGSDALKTQGDAVNDSLLLTQKAVDDARTYELALDDWNDKVLALKVSIGNGLIPVLTDLISTDWDRAMTRGAEATGVAGFAVQAFAGDQIAAADYAAQFAGKIKDDLIPALQDLTLTEEEQAAAAKEMTTANQGLLSLTTSLQSETDRYKNTAAELHEKQDLLRADYVAGTVNAEEYKEKMGELTGAVKENQKAHTDAGNKIMFNLMQQKMMIDGVLLPAELNALEQMGVQWGIFDQQTVNSAHTMMETAGIFDEQLGAITESFVDPVSKMTQANEKLHALQNMSGQTWTYYVNIETSGRFPNMPGGTISGIGGFAPDANCFIAGTLVTMAGGETKPIEEIIEGESVITFDLDTRKNTASAVTQVLHHGAEETEFYLLVNGVGVTSSHLMYASGNWVAAGALRVGDTLTGIDGNPIEIISIVKIDESVPTYNLHVEHTSHNYYANGVLVHNAKQTGGTVYAGRPYMVGEGGAEPFMPSQNGRVLGHAESLHALGLGGGGGGTNYFYGPVTLELSADASNGLMSMR